MNASIHCEHSFFSAKEGYLGTGFSFHPLPKTGPNLNINLLDGEVAPMKHSMLLNCLTRMKNKTLAAKGEKAKQGEGKHEPLL